MHGQNWMYTMIQRRRTRLRGGQNYDASSTVSAIFVSGGHRIVGSNWIRYNA